MNIIILLAHVHYKNIQEKKISIQNVLVHDLFYLNSTKYRLVLTKADAYKNQRWDVMKNLTNQKNDFTH